MCRNAGSDVSEVAEMMRATKMKETGWQVSINAPIQKRG